MNIESLWKVQKSERKKKGALKERIPGDHEKQQNRDKITIKLAWEM